MSDGRDAGHGRDGSDADPGPGGSDGDDPGATPSDGPILEVDGLRTGYGETEVLRGVDFAVETGEVAALVGRNGVGKTTTLRSIVGVVSPRAGTVTFAGEDVTGLDPVATARRGIGFVPEDRRIFPGLTVEENLRMGQIGGSPDSEHRRSIEDVLSTFDNLWERRHNRGANLSGGEQQMLAIARALVAGADLLLLDEPTEGLAPIIVERVQEVVEEVNEEGISVLLVEQNVAVATSLADHVHVLDHGRIVFSGTTEQLEADRSVLDEHLGVSL